MGRFINADNIVSDVGGLLKGSNLFPYCEKNIVKYKDSAGTFCIPAAIVGGVVGAGLSIANSVLSAAITGESLDVGKMLLYATANGIAGAISSGTVSSMLRNITIGAKTIISAGNTLSAGSSISEAIMNGGITLLSELACNSIGFATMPGEGRADLVGNAILSGVLGGEVQGIQQVTTVVSTANGRQQSAGHPTTSATSMPLGIANHRPQPLPTPPAGRGNIPLYKLLSRR